MTVATDTPLNLSDEELTDFNVDSFFAKTEPKEEVTEPVDEESTDAVDTEPVEDVEPKVEEDKEDDKAEDTEEEEETDVKKEDTVDKEVKPVPTKKTTKKVSEEGDVDLSKSPDEDTTKDTKDTASKEDVTPVEINYQDEYNKIFAPFKANGKMMQIDNSDDVRTLMQMGANYNKKMAGLKPNLKIVKMLENNNLLSEDKINYLIDLDKKNPDAIKKLIKESKLDVQEMDPEEEVKYKSNAYNVDDKEVEFDSTLESIRDTESYQTTLEIISTKWDAPSQLALYNKPNDIVILNEQISNGIFEQVVTVVEKERLLGRLAGLSDLEAYVATGNALNAAGKFNKVTPKQVAPVTPVSTTTNKVVDPKLKDKKRAASSTKGLPGKSAPVEYNPLSLSDEEFDKVSKKLL